MLSHTLIPSVVAILILPMAVPAAEQNAHSPFLRTYCFDCHAGQTTEGGLNLASARDLSDPTERQQMIRVFDRIAAGEMPPESAEQPESTVKDTFLKHLSSSLTEADSAGREFVLRRLNRTEYQYTVQDLFGIQVDLTRLLPKDPENNQFDTIASALSLSPQQMAIYIEAADIVLDQVFGPEKPPKRIQKTGNFKDLRSVNSSDRVTSDGIVLFNSRALPMYGVSTAVPGTYRFRVDLKAVQTSDPVVVRVGGGAGGNVAPHVIDFFEVQPGKITSVEFTDTAIERYDTFSFSLVDGYPWYKVDPDSYEGPGLFLGDYELDGPIDDWPPASARQLLRNIDPQDASLNDVRDVLLRVLPRAFRRSTSDEEVEPYLGLAKQAFDEGLPFTKALRRALKGMICAPEFLFMEESTEDANTINDFALASRLSYFLWSSMPDRELLTVAADKKLRQPNVLREQVERMLRDPRSERFVNSFTGQWLRLRDIDFTVPDRLLYPEYNQLLRRSMLDESRAFFREVMTKNLSVQNMIDSDFVMINEPLAKFYGIADVYGLEMRRVQLPDDSVRGGVMTQAGVLKVSADGTSTSPVLRGVWILKNLYGTPPQPPPPSVEAIEPDIRGATTIREQLAKHREHDSCNTCHRHIDPPGFALESFDVVGGARQWYRTRQQGKYVKRLLHPQAKNQSVRYRQGPDVDATGSLSDGRTFEDVRQYKQLLLEDRTAMANSLIRLLLTYALGRQSGFSDRAQIREMVADCESDHYGLRSLIHTLVRSHAFRQR